ncbi:hypothetical protein A3Q56_07802 [Intoshia linei]|uniref:Uncharacterized protein n=1 Tax=Intoshia linei TaxID=1819745 RepID=A0A177AR44_9BILA|nr:hypothetical protein A3Q56_07802 [Intoshia linei]
MEKNKGKTKTKTKNSKKLTIKGDTKIESDNSVINNVIYEDITKDFPSQANLSPINDNYPQQLRMQPFSPQPHRRSLMMVIFIN